MIWGGVPPWRRGGVEEAIQSIAERLPKQSRVQERLNAASRPTWDELTARRRAAVEREGFEESLNAEYRQQLQVCWLASPGRLGRRDPPEPRSNRCGQPVHVTRETHIWAILRDLEGRANPED